MKLCKKLRQAMYVQHNFETRSCNHCCRGKLICYIFWVYFCSLRYSVCNAHAPCYIVICGLSCFAIYFRTVLYTARIFRKRKVIEHKMCVLICSTTFDWSISRSKKNCVRYCHKCTECPNGYRNRHFFNNFTTNEGIAKKFEADLPRCAWNVTS